MDGATDLPRKQTVEDTSADGDSKRQDESGTHAHRPVTITLWIIGFIALLVASVFVRFHPAPWPLEVQTTITMQQLQLWPWLLTPIVWASFVDNVLPSLISYAVWLIGLSLVGIVVWRRGGSPIPWFVTAVFITFGAGLMAGINAVIGNVVARPRPTSPPIHIYMPEGGIPSFPSGHVENDVVYYGFLLYLSLSEPLRHLRYRWILIPLQVYAGLNILFIGYSRVYEGSHWLIDALAGYLTGALCLVVLIVLYRWTLDKLNAWYAKRLLEKTT